MTLCHASLHSSSLAISQLQSQLSLVWVIALMDYQFIIMFIYSIYIFDLIMSCLYSIFYLNLWFDHEHSWLYFLIYFKNVLTVCSNSLYFSGFEDWFLWKSYRIRIRSFLDSSSLGIPTSKLLGLFRAYIKLYSSFMILLSDLSPSWRGSRLAESNKPILLRGLTS